jgi:hypothetical protein
MQTRVLGSSGLEVSAIGLGCMRMSAGHGEVAATKEEMIALLRTAVELGINHHCLVFPNRLWRLQSPNYSRTFGYTFGYRYQFGLFTFNFAKPLAIGHLSGCNPTVNYAYFS